MGLDDIVSVSITANTTSPTRPGFGTPLFLAYHTHSMDRVREYSSLAEMVTAGYATTETGYKMAAKYFSQNPRGKKVKIGRASVPDNMSVTILIPATILEGQVFSIKVDNTTCSYTAQNGDETGDVGTALELLIEAAVDAENVNNVNSSFLTDTITFTTSSMIVPFSNWTSNLTVTNNSTDRGIGDDLDACFEEDPDWYGLAIEGTSQLEILAAAAWAETHDKLFGATSNDTGITDSDVTDDTATELLNLAYARTFLIYNGNDSYGFSACAWLGKNFPYNPGYRTWNLNTLSGVSIDSLTSGQQSAMAAKKASYYVTIAGINVTQGSQLFDGNFIDTRHFLDWLKAEIQIRVFALLASNPKIPFTNKGIAAVVSEIYGALAQGIAYGGIAEDPKPEVFAPDVADISTIDKAARNLPDVTFTATLAGAIHTVSIAGTVSL